MKTVLISGGTGFLGCHTCKLLASKGYKLVVLKRPTSDLSRLDDIKSAISYCNLEENSLEEIFQTHPIDYVIHMATAYGRDNNHHRVFETNVNFATQLLNQAIQNDVKKFINTDTFSSKQKGLSYLPAYHNSKKQFREWGQFVSSESNTQFITFYLQHPYGPHDNEDKFVYFIMKSLITGVSHIDLTEGLQQRDFIHATDVASAYLRVLEALELNTTEFEIGSGSSISIRDFILKVKDITNNSNTKLNFGALETRANEIMNIEIDLEPLEQIGWQAEVSLEKGLEDLANWYRNKLN